MPARVLLIHSLRISKRRIRELGREISRDYAKVETLHLICVLKGAFMFLADLVRTLAGSASRWTSWRSRVMRRARPSPAKSAC